MSVEQRARADALKREEEAQRRDAEIRHGAGNTGEFGDVGNDRVGDGGDGDRSEDDAGATGSADCSTWEAPVEFNSPTFGPPVPLEALPSAVGDYVSAVACVHQVSADLVAAAALGTLAAAGAGRVEVEIGSTHVEPVNLYIAPVADPGERKAQVLRCCAFPLEDVERELVVAAGPRIAAATQRRAVEDRRLKVLHELAAKADDPAEREKHVAEATQLEQALTIVPASPQLLFDDVTPEAVAKALAEQGGRIAIFSEEAGGLFEMLAGRYANGVTSLDVHLKAYDGGMIRANRVSRSRVVIDRPALTIVVTPQPTILDTIATHPDFRGRGLLGRFAFVLPRSLVGHRRYQKDCTISADVRETYARAVRAILALDLRPRRLRIEQDALTRWAAYADELETAQAEGGRLSHLRDWASKHAGRVARIAALLHLVEHPTAEPAAIAVETITAAWVLGQWLEGHALAAFGRMSADPRTRIARWVLAWIRRHRFATFTLRQLADHKRDVDRPEDFLPALGLLEARHFLRPDPPATPRKPGRPASPSFTVNPQTHADNSDNSENPLPSPNAGELPELSELSDRGGMPLRSALDCLREMRAAVTEAF
jgi:replicative DNA helicase